MSLLKRIERSYQQQSQQAPPEGQPTNTTVSAPPASDATGSKLEELRLRKQAAAPVRDVQRELRERIHARLISELDPKLDVSKTDEVRRSLEALFNTALEEENVPMNRADRAKLFEQIVADILGFGPIERLLGDDTISEIMVNGPRAVYIER
ncbi:MAG: CpaF family protein, partial [Chloroflexi bacterium]